MAGANLCKEAAFGLGEVEVAAPHGPRRPARCLCREGCRGVAVAGVLLPVGLPPVGDGGPVRLFGGWAPGVNRACAEDYVPDSLGFCLVSLTGIRRRRGGSVMAEGLHGESAGSPCALAIISTRIYLPTGPGPLARVIDSWQSRLAKGAGLLR